jgi:hypothetical protein
MHQFLEFGALTDACQGAKVALGERRVVGDDQRRALAPDTKGKMEHWGLCGALVGLGYLQWSHLGVEQRLRGVRGLVQQDAHLSNKTHVGIKEGDLGIAGKSDEGAQMQGESSDFQRF